MKINLNESMSNTGEYIGGKLFDFVEQYGYPDDTDESEEAWIKRAETMDNYIVDFSSNYIVYKPDSYNKFELWSSDIDYYTHEMWEGLAIKEGVDLIAFPLYLEAIGYYGRGEDVVYLYPISNEKADELSEIIDNADFDESDVIENEIAQYTYNGASIEDVLISWGTK